MKTVIVLFVIAMIIKDVKFIGDAYWIRGVTQVTVLFLGFFLIISRANFSILKKHYLVFLYIVLIFLSITYSPFKTYTFLQVASLCAPITFYIGISLLQNSRQFAIEKILFKTIIYAYFVACCISLAIYFLARGLVIEVLWGNELRFTGVFTEPAMMGLISGLALGLALLSKINKFLKITVITVAAICLFLTLSRTFFIALIVAAAATGWLYYPKYKKWYLVLFGSVTFLTIVLATHSVVLSKQEQDNIEHISRAGSISSLSGRTAIWDAVIEQRKKEGLAGEGFAMGGALLLKNKLNAYVKMDPRAVGRVTMHSGYIQALADLGYPGLVLYSLIIIMAIFRVYSKDKTREHGLLFFCVIYLAISNSAESVIYTASTFPSLLFWFLVISSATLRPGLSIKEKKISDSKVKAGKIKENRALA